MPRRVCAFIGEPEDAGEEPRGGVLVARRDDGVIELDGHGGPRRNGFRVTTETQLPACTAVEQDGILRSMRVAVHRRRAAGTNSGYRIYALFVLIDYSGKLIVLSALTIF